MSTAQNSVSSAQKHSSFRVSPLAFGRVVEDIIRFERSDFRPGFQHVEHLCTHWKRISAYCSPQDLENRSFV